MLYIFFKCVELMILGAYCVLHFLKNNIENVQIPECNEELEHLPPAWKTTCNSQNPAQPSTALLCNVLDLLRWQFPGHRK